MPDYDLDDLLSALNEVAADSNPDDDDRDPNDDPDDDDSRDPNDDDWDREQAEDGEEDDGTDDDDGDYASRRSVMRLEELNAEAERWTFNQRIAKTKQPKKPINKADQNMNEISALRQKTSQINFELETGKQLAAEKKQYQEASVAMYLANLSPAEKRERDKDMRRIVEHCSAICPEASPSWREQARAAFRNKRL
jgi:hypothetical protein